VYVSKIFKATTYHLPPTSCAANIKIQSTGTAVATATPTKLNVHSSQQLNTSVGTAENNSKTTAKT